MPTQTISFGVPFTMLAGVAYAVPAPQSTIYCDTPLVVISQSHFLNFSSNSGITLTSGSGLISATYLKSNIDALVTIKRN